MNEKEKKVGQVQPELTSDKDDKHPFRRRRQKAVSEAGFKEKDIVSKLREAENVGTQLALKIANKESENLRKRLGFKVK